MKYGEFILERALATLSGNVIGGRVLEEIGGRVLNNDVDDYNALNSAINGAYVGSWLGLSCIYPLYFTRNYSPDINTTMTAPNVLGFITLAVAVVGASIAISRRGVNTRIPGAIVGATGLEIAAGTTACLKASKAIGINLGTLGSIVILSGLGALAGAGTASVEGVGELIELEKLLLGLIAATLIVGAFGTTPEVGAGSVLVAAGVSGFCYE